MNILLTNDDGIYADGLWTLYKRFADRHAVTVIAPDHNQSAVSHRITLHQPLRIEKVSGPVGSAAAYSVSGTPADCVKIGIHEILDVMPDMVISGINSGSNVGSSINYSGTAAAAREAVLYGIAAIAVSMHGYKGKHYENAARFTEMLADQVSEKGLPFGMFLNVNLPDVPLEDLAGVRLTHQEVTRQSEYFDKRTDPRDMTYYWLGSDIRRFDEEPDSDAAALFQNYISVTPLKCDLTDYEMLEELKQWDIYRVRGER